MKVSILSLLVLSLGVRALADPSPVKIYDPRDPRHVAEKKSSSKIVKSAPNGRTYEETYQQVCEGADPDERCDRIGKDFKRDLGDTVKELKPVIYQAARTYGVEPRAIVASLLAEHSMNVDASDYIQDALLKSGLSASGGLDFGFFKKSFQGGDGTAGFGQLNFSRAMEAEEVASQVEGRAMRTKEQITQALLTPEGSVYYAAALLRQAQDLYLTAGYDLSEDTAVLATLYNIGKIQERLERTKREGRPPQPNYFGTWTLKFKKEIDEIVSDYNPKAETVAEKASKAPADSKYVSRYQAKEILMPLKSGMTSVGTNSAAFAGASFVLKADDTFEIKGSIEDAVLGTLHLIENENGELGFLPETIVQNKARWILALKTNCQAKGDKKCLADMQTYLTERNGETFAHMTEQNQPQKKKLSPEEELLLLAQKRVEDLLAKLNIQPITADDAQAAQAAVKKLEDFLGPAVKDYPTFAANKIAELELKEKKLRALPKLGQADLAEMLGAVRTFREKAAKAQGDSRGPYVGPYANLEPLFNFYEACALQHHGSSPEITKYFNQIALSKAATLNSEVHDYGTSILEEKSTDSQYSSAFDNWLFAFIRENRAAQPAEKVKGGRKGEMVRKDDGQNCYGDKKQFLAWIHSIPVKASPEWSDLGPVYLQAKAFYYPVKNESELQSRIQSVPSEIAREKKQLKKRTQQIAKFYPSIEERMKEVVAQAKANTGAKNVAESDPLVKAYSEINQQLAQCMIVSLKNKELVKRLETFQTDLDENLKRILEELAYRSGNRNDGPRLLSGDTLDSFYYLVDSLDPNLSSTRDFEALIRLQLPASFSNNEEYARWLRDLGEFAKHLKSACGSFQDPTFTAYLADPQAFGDSGKTCTVEVTQVDNYGDLQKIETSLVEMAQKFSSEKERAEYLIDLLDNQRFYRSRYEGYDINQATLNPARFPDYTSLVKHLSELDCVKSIVVSRVQELTLPKTIMIPNGNSSSVRVNWKGTKCN